MGVHFCQRRWIGMAGQKGDCQGVNALLQQAVHPGVPKHIQRVFRTELFRLPVKELPSSFVQQFRFSLGNTGLLERIERCRQLGNSGIIDNVLPAFVRRLVNLASTLVEKPSSWYFLRASALFLRSLICWPSTVTYQPRPALCQGLGNFIWNPPARNTWECFRHAERLAACASRTGPPQGASHSTQPLFLGK